MRYMLLIYDQEGGPGPKPGTPEHEKMMAGYWDFHEEVQRDGVFVAGDPLHGIDTASTVRVRDGETVVSDGPFAETKEQLGGYYILECEDLDGALEYAAKIPTAEWGSIEVRPILDMTPDDDPS